MTVPADCEIVRSALNELLAMPIVGTVAEGKDNLYG